MRAELIDYLKNNEYLRELFSDFINDFKKEYLSLKVGEKKELLKLKDEIFRNWLYSSIINETYITPYFLINSLAQDNEKGEYVVIPRLLVNESKDKKQIDIEIKFDSYSENSYPVLNDIDKIVEAASPSLILQYKDIYVINEENQLIKNISIESEYYINYLIQLCKKLGVIKEIKAINCKCFQKGNYYDQFDKLSPREKFNEVINKTLEISTENINSLSNIQNLIDKNYFNKFLNNNIDDTDFIDLVNELIPFANNFVENIEDFTDEQNIIETIEFAKLLIGENVGSFVMGTEIRLYFDIYFTTIFSYYLGILAPVYMGTFLIKEIAIGLKESTTFFQKCANIFNDELEHNLTAFGEAIMLRRGEKLEENTYDKIEEADYVSILDKAKSEKEQVEARYEQCREIYGSDSNLIHTFMNIINDSENIEKGTFIKEQADKSKHK